jgi:RNA polymerase sigma-70 factor (ECF subfamily)
MTRTVCASESPLESLADYALIDGALAGDPAALGVLLSRHRDRAYRLALYLSGNPSDAEDIVQEAFLRVFTHLASFSRRARFTTWLYRVVTNAALMHKRTARRRRSDSLEAYLPAFNAAGRHRRIDVDYSAAARVEQIVAQHQLKRQLIAGLQRLPLAYRTAIVLRDLEELSSKEAAEVLKCDEQTLRQRVHRGRLMMRGYMDDLARRRAR